MVSKCTYLPNEYVIPKNSLLYQEYMMLSELNNLNVKIDGLNSNFYKTEKGIKLKQYLYENVCKEHKTISSSVLLKGIYNWIQENEIKKDVEKKDINFKIGGEDFKEKDAKLKSSLSSYNALKDIKLSDDNKENDERKEKLIEMYTIFGKETDVARDELNEKYEWYNNLDENVKNEIDKSLSSVSGWGKLSKEFITGLTVKTTDTSEAKSIITLLYEANYNLQELLYGVNNIPPFNDVIKEYNISNDVIKESARNIKTLKYEDLENLYVPTNTKRAIWQAVKIVRELVGIVGYAPKKIFIETNRYNGEKNKTVQSRYKSLKDKYDAITKMKNDINKEIIKQDIKELEEKLKENESYLSNDKLYLYFSQMGKDLYSGEPIKLEDVKNGENYDKDHIYPYSLSNDNSLIDNLVLVSKELNRDKSNKTLKEVIGNNGDVILKLWKILKDKDLISKEKYRRLVYALNHKEFEPSEIEGFVNRQLVETSQSTKAVKNLLTIAFSELDDNNKRKTEIVFSKARLVSDFRNEYGFPKSRIINDAHHAKDAYLNVVVGNVYNTKYNHDWKFLYKDKEQIKNINISVKLFKFNVPGAWDKEKSIQIVEKTMTSNDCLLTRMQIVGKGELFNATVYSNNSNKGDSKNDEDRVMSIKKGDLHYGYYNKLSTSYFVLIVYKDGSNKPIMSVETIPVWFVNQFGKKLSKDELVKSYAKLPKIYGGLGLNNINVLASNIKIKSLLEYNGMKLYRGYISGKTGKSFTFETANILDMADWENYAIQICKFVEKRNEYKEYTVEKFNYRVPLKDKNEEIKRGKQRPLITNDKNIDFYNYFIELHNEKNFIGRPNSQLDIFKTSKDMFDKLNEEEQCNVLYEIIEYFNGEKCNLSLIGGSQQAGFVRLNQKVSDGLTIINQSITGLFESRQKFSLEDDI